MILLVKRGDGLYSPAYDKDFDESKKIKPGEIVAAKTNEVRNVMFHRKYFALLNFTLNNLPESISKRVNTTDHLLTEIKLHLGLYDLQVTTKGSQIYVPKSISFTSMSQKRFEEFYSNSLDVILSKYLPDISREQVENELINFF